MNLSAIVVPQITYELIVSPVMSTSGWDHLSDLRLADSTFGTPACIDVLFGVDIYTSALLQGRKLDPPGIPAAIKSEFCWVLAGIVKNPCMALVT